MRIIKRYETPLLWAYVLSLIVSMLLFAAVGFWLYLVFACLAIPMLIATVVHWLKGASPDGDSWIMILAVLAFLVIGAYSYAARGLSWPPKSASAQAEAIEEAGRSPAFFA